MKGRIAAGLLAGSVITAVLAGPALAEVSGGAKAEHSPYGELVSAHLKKRVQFFLGRRRPTAGLVMMSFKVSPIGTVFDVRVRQSSGKDELDKLAVELVSGASPFPVAPDGRINSFTVPIRFQPKVVRSHRR